MKKRYTSNQDKNIESLQEAMMRVIESHINGGMEPAHLLHNALSFLAFASFHLTENDELRFKDLQGAIQEGINRHLDLARRYRHLDSAPWPEEDRSEKIVLLRPTITT